MSIALAEYDVWPRVRAAVREKLAETMDGFLHATDWETVVRLQVWAAAMEWVLAEARPPEREGDDA